MTQPQSSDAILGNQTPPPVNSAILGGIEGLHQQMMVSTPEQRSNLLPSALNYGESGIDFLISALRNDSVLTVRAAAYQQLQQNTIELEGGLLEKVQQAIAQGIPLKLGDILYSVYELVIGYDDENYFIGSSTIPEDNTTEGDYFDIAGKDSFQEINLRALSDDEMEEFYEQWEVPKLISRHVFKEAAEEKAEKLHLERILDRNTPELFEFDYFQRYNFNINAWCVANGLPPIPHEEENGWDALNKLVEQFKTSQESNLLSQFWKDTIGQLVITHQQVISRDCYFKVTHPL
jgi:hypothetical protein